MSKLQQRLTAILRAKKDRIGVPTQTLKQWERGDNSPTLERVEKICEDNDISFFSLIEFNTHEFIKIANLEAEKSGAKIVVTFESK